MIVRLCRILCKIPGCLRQSNLDIILLAQDLTQSLMDNKTQVFSGSWNVFKFFYFYIEIAVVKIVFDVLTYNLFQVIEIDQHTGLRVDVSGNFDLKFIVVTVKMGIRTFSKNLLVLFLTPALDM